MANGYNKRTKRDILQVRAFHLVYRLLGEDEYYYHRPYLRFITAICRTADDIMDNILKEHPDIIRQWFKLRSRKAISC